MSSAVAAARKRRAGIQSAPTMGPPPTQQNNPVGQSSVGGAPPQNGLTLQQVINVINGRLLTLETAEKERKERESAAPTPASAPQPSGFSLNAQSDTPLQDDEVEIPIGEILSDYNQRFEILTQELAELKTLVLKLQSYTMDVNRTLLEDRFIIPTPDVAETVSNSDIAPVEGESDTIDPAPTVSEGENITIQMDSVNDPAVDAPSTPAVLSSGNKKKGSKNVSINL